VGFGGVFSLALAGEIRREQTKTEHANAVLQKVFMSHFTIRRNYIIR
jgi:hypothetical protein